MKYALLLLIASNAWACQPGFVPSDVEGVCVERPVEETNPAWIVNEKPPEDKMPSYQREGIKVIEEPNLTYSDAQADQEKARADADGKKMAGIK